MILAPGFGLVVLARTRDTVSAIVQLGENHPARLTIRFVLARLAVAKRPL